MNARTSCKIYPLGGAGPWQHDKGGEKKNKKNFGESESQIYGTPIRKNTVDNNPSRHSASRDRPWKKTTNTIREEGYVTQRWWQGVNRKNHIAMVVGKTKPLWRGDIGQAEIENFMASWKRGNWLDFSLTSMKGRCQKMTKPSEHGIRGGDPNGGGERQRGPRISKRNKKKKEMGPGGKKKKEGLKRRTLGKCPYFWGIRRWWMKTALA